MKFIIDEEIDLKQNDILNTKVYAETLKSAIKNSPVDKSFTIGLFGEWGSGKSSIIKTVENELQKDKKENIKFIIYDAWKYANDSFRRMFLLKVQETLKFEKTSLMNSFYLNESEDVEIKKKLNKTNLLIIGILMLVGIITINLIPTESENWKFSLSIFISFLGLITTILLKAFDEFKVNIQKPHLFAPEQFEECFFEMISKSMKKYSPVEKAYQWVQGNRFIKDIDKLIVVIDNIDRCNKELAYELLTDTKSFLGNTKNVIFLIPVDDEALKKHILSSNANNKEAEEFLRKYFNTTVRIKPFKTIDLFDFANKLNLKYSLNFNPDTIDIIAKEYATNPRRIIQFFNNLVVELTNFENNFTKEFAEKYESLICKLLIIREEWPQFYKLISDRPHLINDNSKEKDELLNRYKDLSSFLKNTNAISKGINITVYEKLLSNNNAFKELNDELLDIINNQKFEALTEKIELGSKKTQIVNYAIEGLKNGKEFLETAKKVCKKKPIVVIKGGKTKEGKKATLSHTGSLAGSYEAYKGAFKQARIIEAKNLREFLIISKTLAFYQKIKGEKTLVITNGGGYGILAVDALSSFSIPLARISKKSVKKLKKVLPENAIVDNPIDLLGDATPERYEITLKTVMKDKNVNLILLIILSQLPTLSGIENVIEKIVVKKPLFIVTKSEKIRKIAVKKGIPSYDFPEEAALAIKSLIEINKK